MMMINGTDTGSGAMKHCSFLFQAVFQQSGDAAFFIDTDFKNKIYEWRD